MAAQARPLRLSADRGARHGGETGRLRIYSSCRFVYLGMRKTLEDPPRRVFRVKRRRVALGPADPNRVDLGNPVEVRWWCR